MIEFLIVLFVWCLIGYLSMRFIIIPLDRDAFWSAKELVWFTLGWPIVLLVVAIIFSQEWYKNRPKKESSFGDFLRKVYGLK